MIPLKQLLAEGGYRRDAPSRAPSQSRESDAAKDDRLTIANLPRGVLMELAQQVDDGEPLPPRIVRVREWAHWNEPSPSVRIDTQTLLDGAVVFLLALPSEDPRAWVRERRTQESLPKRVAQLAVALLDMYFGLTGREEQKPGPKPGSHRGLDDRTWWEMMQKIDELRAINAPWASIEDRYPRWSERTLSGWLKEFRSRRATVPPAD